MTHETTMTMHFYPGMDKYDCGEGEPQRMPPYTPVKILKHGPKNKSRFLVETEQGAKGWIWIDMIQPLTEEAQA
jgi:hypothetical protein